MVLQHNSVGNLNIGSKLMAWVYEPELGWFSRQQEIMTSGQLGEDKDHTEETLKAYKLSAFNHSEELAGIQLCYQREMKMWCLLEWLCISAISI